MAVARWLETDSLSNQNISSALAIGAYTADADRMIVCDVSLDQVAGGGDYVIYITRQINGAGSAYVLLPKTTCAAASGETAIAMQSGPITVRSGDVLTVYVDGLAGDTTTPDTVVRWFEMAALRPTDAGRTLDIAATGEASANVTYWAGVAVAAADANGSVPAALHPTQGAVTFGQVKILANVSGQGALHVVNSNASGRGQYNFGGDTGLYNYGISQGQFNYGLYGQYNYGSDAGLRNQATSKGQHNVGTTPVSGVDAAGTRAALGMAAANLDEQLEAIGVDPQDVADAMLLAPTPPATAAAGSVQAKLGDGVDALEAALLAGLSGATVTVVSSVDGGLVLVYAADTWRFTVSSDALEALGLADYEVLGLVVKRDARQTDSQALLYLRTDTGLARIDGAAPASAANGAVTAGSGSFSGVVHVAETVGVTPGEYSWWLKGIDTTPTPDEAATLATGRFLVMPAGLQAVV
mgnify:CR=1 FL=1